MAIPSVISKSPEIVDHILLGRELNLCSFLPKKFPKLKNINWKDAINNGKSIELIPIILPPTPMQKLSNESARPRKRASLESIELEESKSEYIGFLIIFIVIPKKSIKKLYIFSLLISLLFVLKEVLLSKLFLFLK